jgi:hypothetical protein
LCTAAASGDVAACREVRECTEGSRSRLDVYEPIDPEAALPVLEVVFVESDGDGRPKGAHIVDGNVNQVIPGTDESRRSRDVDRLHLSQ